MQALLQAVVVVVVVSYIVRGGWGGVCDGDKEVVMGEEGKN